VEAYDPDGVLCGEFSTRVEGIYGFMPVYGDDPATSDVDEGAEYGDQLTFVCEGAELEVDAGTAFWQGDQLLLNVDLAFTSDTGSPDEEIPASYNLYPARPNPLTSGTTLRYDLPERANVKLVVYDVAGRVVAVVADGVADAGAKSVRWDGRDSSGQPVASGVYYYRLLTDDYSAEGRMVVIR
jgi:hypothetical protein